MSTSLDPTTRSGPSRLRWALVASIALNLFLVGWLAGGFLNRPPFGLQLRHSMIERLDGRLSREGFRRVEPQLRAFQDVADGGMADFGRLRRQLQQSAGSANFDAEAMRRDLAGLSQARNAQDSRFSERIVAILQDLDPADRAVFVESVFPPMPNPGDRPPPAR